MSTRNPMRRAEVRDMTADAYERRAELHRPRCTRELHAEIRRQLSTGLRPRDVASALRLDLAAVLAAAAERDA